MNMESLVTARHHRAVNTSLLLAHTARRSTRVKYGRGMDLCLYRTYVWQGGRSRNKVAAGEPAAGSPPKIDPLSPNHT